MSINFLNINWDVCDKVDEIFKKHKINFSYRKYIEKITKPYKGDMYQFTENFDSYGWVDYTKFKNIQYGKRVIEVEKDFDLLQLDGGFVRKVCLPPKIEDINAFDNVCWDWEYITDLEDLDNKLTEMETRYAALIKFFKSPEMKKSLAMIDKLNQESEEIDKKKMELREKIQKQIKKIININNDF